MNWRHHSVDSNNKGTIQTDQQESKTSIPENKSFMLTQILNPSPKKQNVLNILSLNLQEQDESFEYPDPEKTIRYDKAEEYKVIFNETLDALISEAYEYAPDFQFEMAQKKANTKVATKNFARQNKKMEDIKGLVSPEAFNQMEQDKIEEEKEELELIKTLQSMEWNKNLMKIMPQDLRMNIQRPPEFYRAQTYLIIKKGMAGIKFDKIDK